MNNFAERLSKTIDATGQTVADLSRRSGVARPYIHRILAGKQVPSIEIAQRLAEAAGLKIVISTVDS